MSVAILLTKNKYNKCSVNNDNNDNNPVSNNNDDDKTMIIIMMILLSTMMANVIKDCKNQRSNNLIL